MENIPMKPYPAIMEVSTRDHYRKSPEGSIGADTDGSGNVVGQCVRRWKASDAHARDMQVGV